MNVIDLSMYVRHTSCSCSKSVCRYLIFPVFSSTDPDPKFKDDNFCLLMLLRGMCLKGMKSPLQAQECFEKVMEYNGKLKGDKHLIPYTMYEFSLLVRDEGRLEAALAMMEKAK